GGYFLGEAQGEGVDRTLGGGVIDVLVGRAQAGSGRGDVDDGPSAPAMAGGHAPDGFAGAKEAADHIGRQDAAQPPGVHVLDAHLPLEDAGVVDQRRDRPQLAIDLGKEARDIGRVANVAGNGHGLAPGALDLLHESMRGCLVAQVIDAHRVAVRSAKARGCGTNAPAAAGNYQYLPHGLLPSACCLPPATPKAAVVIFRRRCPPLRPGPTAPSLRARRRRPARHIALLPPPWRRADRRRLEPEYPSPRRNRATERWRGREGFPFRLSTCKACGV